MFFVTSCTPVLRLATAAKGSASVSSGVDNVAVGADALGTVSTGSSNVAVGVDAGTAVTGADGKTLTDRSDAAKEAVLTLKFRDGDLAAVPAGSPASPPSSAPARRPKRRTAAPPGQEDLFG